MRKTDVRPTRFPLPRCRAPNLRGQSVSARGSVFTLQVPTLFGNNDFPGCIRFRTSVSRDQAFLGDSIACKLHDASRHSSCAPWAIALG